MLRRRVNARADGVHADRSRGERDGASGAQVWTDLLAEEEDGLAFSAKMSRQSPGVVSKICSNRMIPATLTR
jgi:hypothetical protein